MWWLVLIPTLVVILLGTLSGVMKAVNDRGGWIATWNSLINNASQYGGKFLTTEGKPIPQLPANADVSELTAAVNRLILVNNTLASEVATLRQKVENIPTPPSASATAQAVWGDPIETSDGSPMSPFDVIRSAVISALGSLKKEE